MRSGLNHFSAPPFGWHLICWFILFPPHRHYSTPLFTAPVISPPPPLLHPNYRCIVCVLPPHARRPTHVFAPPANPAHTRDRRACAACHLWATWSHRLPSLYVHMRKCLLFLRLIIICAAILRPKCHWRRGGGGWWWRLLMSLVLPGNKCVFPVGRVQLPHQWVVVDGLTVVVLWVCLCLFVFVSPTLSDRQQMPFVHRAELALKSELDLLRAPVLSNKL